MNVGLGVGGSSTPNQFIFMSKKSLFKNLKDIPAHIPPPPVQTGVFAVYGAPFALDWVFTFGKFRRPMRTLEQAIDEDPDYVSWCLTNVAGFTITPAAQDHLILALHGE